MQTSSSADDPSSSSPLGAVPVTTTEPGQSGGTFHDLLAAFTTNDGTAFGRLRQILMITFGIGFVTAAGFITATWRSRVRIARAENLHRTDHGRRRGDARGIGELFHR